MASELTITSKLDGEKLRFLLAGKIDENSDYATILSAASGQIILDFNDVTLINSSGIQKWIQFLQAIPASTKVDFDNCPLRIVNQMNLFPAFCGGRSIVPLAFYAPFYCEKCDASKNIRLVTAEHFQDLKAIKVPAMNCPSCQSSMEFDGIEKKYFIFLQRLT